MQKGVFTTWIKELCALVFVQTIQAFILAIVLSIMLTFLLPYKTDDGKASITSQDTVSALGVLCIVLLTSLTKMEQITKKIFGLDSGILQNKPPHGLMTSFLALKAASKALNNVPKVIGGIGKISSGGLDRRKARNANLTRLKRAGLDTNGKPAIGGGSDNSPSEAMPANATEQDLDTKEYYQKPLEAKKKGDIAGYHKNMGIQAGLNKAQKNASLNPSQAITTKSTPKDVSKDYWKIMDKFDDELSKAKAKQSEGAKELLSGLTETAGSITGALGGLSVGLTTGLATGDLDQIPKAIGFGVGIGDTVGKSVIDAGSAVKRGTQNINSHIKATKELNDNLAKMEKSLQIQKKNKMNAAARFKDVQKAIKQNNNINDL